MRPSQARFVTACQQLLALAVVLVVLAPAAGVATLDVVDRFPGADGPDSSDLRLAPGTAALENRAAATAPEASEVETAPVEPEVVERPLTTATGEPGAAARTGPGANRESGGDRAPDTVVSEPEPVSGYGAVGVTWDAADAREEDQIAVEVRTRTGTGQWSGWDEMEYHDEHGPDPDSAEGRDARPGTEPTFVGEVDEVQVRTVATGAATPADLTLAVVGPGESSGTELEAPEYGGEPEAAAAGAGALASSEGDLALQATGSAPRPTIYSRQQWGADERLRSGSPSYGSVQGAFVHHTVNANNYTQAQVPGMLRSIYAYHTRSRGWSDVGYNFLVDRFGRIWEGRFGGVTRAVVGAHTLNYNGSSFAMSAIGNFDVAQPPAAMIAAYGRLLGWKLGIHDVNAAARNVRVGSRTFPHAINGHRDAGSTACPGRYLYAKLPQIRTQARSAQTSGGGTTPPPTSPPTTPPPTTPPPTTPPSGPPISSTPRLTSDLLGSSHPDVVVRRGDNRLLVLPTAGGTGFAATRTLPRTFPASARLTVTADVTGDRRGDLVSMDRGRATVYPGNGRGGFGNATATRTGFAGMDLLVGVGDLDGDGRNDLLGRVQKTGRAFAFLGNGRGGFAKVQVPGGWSGYAIVAGAGDVDGDGRDDLVTRDRSGRLHLHRALAPTAGARVRLAAARQVPGDYRTTHAIAGVGDVTKDGRPDLLMRRTGGAAYVQPVRPDLTLGPAYGPVSGLAGLVAPTSGADLTGDGWPDVVARKSGRLTVTPHRGTTETLPPVVTNVDAKGANLVMNTGDFDGDGKGDVVIRLGNGVLNLYRGDGTGRFTGPTRIGTGFGEVTGLRPVGDVTGDGKGDLLGTMDGANWVWTGRGAATLGAKQSAPAGLVRYVRGATVSQSGYDWGFQVSALSGSGQPALVLGSRGSKALWTQTRNSDGSYGGRRLLTTWTAVWNLVG